jgi:hypothetical protein
VCLIALEWSRSPPANVSSSAPAIVAFSAMPVPYPFALPSYVKLLGNV